MQNEEQGNCLEKLRQVTADFDNFAYIVSHDLKAPVRAITNISNWIEEDLGNEIPEEVKENLDLLRNRADRLEKMINALLVFSRVGRLNTEIKMVSVQEIVNQIKADIALPGHVEFNISPNLPVITTYPDLLKSVLQEILDNAIRFNDKHKAIINLEVNEQASLVIFTLTDNGPGIPEEAIPKIFSMFYTVQVKDKVNTTGAGLAIAKKAAAIAGATIDVTSDLNQGSVFRVSWPKA